MCGFFISANIVWRVYDHLQDVVFPELSHVIRLTSEAPLLYFPIILNSLHFSFFWLFFFLSSSLRSLISALQRNQAHKQHLYGCVCVCATCVVRKGVSCSIVHHSVCLFSSVHFYLPFSVSLPLSLSFSVCPIPPLSGLQFYNLLKICFSPALCFLLLI